MFEGKLPEHPNRRYTDAQRCIYCGSRENLHDEHIIPYALGGRWILPNASCDICGAMTSAFEGTCSRTILGALRMLYGIKTRRPKERPGTLPFKIKRNKGDPWTEVEIPREQYPFLVVLPHFPMPDELSGYTTMPDRGAAAKTFWIRGASGFDDMTRHLERLAQQLDAAEVFPTGECKVPEFCLMLAKIAHAFSVAELGANFFPFLPAIITSKDLSNRAQFIGGFMNTEPASKEMHEVSFDAHTCNKPEIVSVRIRLLSCLEAPTYFVAAGRRLST